ncbi:hypothetical protein BS78_K054800 [Paspalum vaginatum]|uniref:Cyclin-dependent kinase inhibitor domain-containing protein n=1 Tax=Paspalum vaginatum TaxID=158149 RepID=A0A9W7XDF8_9POAL|nr:hypothetical protein BS78_K054800 [Paspalum vaginatum]
MAAAGRGRHRQRRAGRGGRKGGSGQGKRARGGGVRQIDGEVHAQVQGGGGGRRRGHAGRRRPHEVALRGGGGRGRQGHRREEEEAAGAGPGPAPAAEPAAAVGAGGDGSGSCYIQLRSRTLFMAPPQQQQQPSAPAPAAGACQGGAAGLSRCSSTASSVDVGAQGRTHACAAEVVGGDHVPEVSATNSGSGPDRERRETTPSSRADGEVSDLESDLAGQKTGRPVPAPTPADRLVMPPKEEIEAFFKAAEEARAKSFAAKYNFDIVRGVPIDGGRFKWTPVFSI